MSNAEWATGVKRRETLSSDCRERDVKLKAWQAAEAAQSKVAMERPGLPPNAGQYSPGGVSGSQASVASLPNFLPSSPTLFQESHGHNTPHSRFSPSPEYADGDPLGGFNPNIAFPHCPPPRGPPVFNADINIPYGSLAYACSPVLRRGPLPFVLRKNPCLVLTLST